MAINGEVIGIANITDFPVGLVGELGQIALWLQAVGAIVVLWIIFELIILYFNRKRMKEIYQIKEDMRRIERKIDNILKKN